MTAHLTTSHGADFFGVDRHALPALTALAPYARAALPAEDPARWQTIKLLESPATVDTVPAADMPALAAALRTVARSRGLRSPRLAATAALLADAAARAATDREPWTLTPQLDPTVRITSYGVGHQDDPAIGPQAVVVDTTELRNPPDDPAVRARLTQMTGLDPEVQRYVLATTGAAELVARHVREIERLAATGSTTIEVLVHCYGGRHRSVAISETIAADVRTLGYGTHVEHRHIDRPLLPSRRATEDGTR